MRVLILEDNNADAYLCKREITDTIADCIVDLAPNIANARDLLNSGIFYDLALLDVNLPDGNGLELLTEIREKELETAVVIFTDQGNEELAVSALKAGANDYIAKRHGFISELPKIITLAVSNFRKIQIQKAEIINAIYIEHNQLDVDLTLRYLRKYAPNVRLKVFTTAEEVIKLFRNSPREKCSGDFHLLLMDYRLPGMNAMDFIKTVRQERMIDIPIIIVTGQGDEEIAVQTLKLGANNYIIKNENYLTRLPLLIKEAYQQCELTRKQAELKASESKYRLLAENSGDVIFTLDREFRFTYSSPAVKKLRGYDPEEVLNQQISDMLTPESYSNVAKVIEEYFTFFSENSNELPPEKTLELELKRKDGTTVWAEVKSSLIIDDNGEITGIVGVSRDITERRAATNELRKLSRAVEQSPESIFITDTEGNIEFCNPAVSLITGYSKEELIGQNPRIFKSGQTTEEEYRVMWDTITAGSIWQGEFLNKKKNGELYWESTSIAPVSDHSGKITHYLAIKEDVTQQKQMLADLIEAKEKAQESDMLKSAFLANLSHEIRTPMNGIMGFAELLKEPGLTGEEQQNYIAVIEKSGVRMLNIINDIISISKIEAGLTEVNIQPVIISDLLNNLYSFFRTEVEGKGMQFILSKTIPSSETIIMTDRDKVYAILSNLLKNAVKYTNKGLIEFGCSVKRENDTSLLEFYVKDTGIGIPAERQEAIFKRFIQADITDKMAYQGAGLGLSISKAYAEILGGKIWVESEEGNGSLFYFTLPHIKG